MQIALEILPTFIFVGSYVMGYDLIWATGFCMLSAFIGTLIILIVHKKWSKIQIASFISFMVFGGLTILLKEPSYIKMKATFVYLFLASGIWYSVYVNKPIIKILAADKLDLDDATWIKLCHRFAIYFVVMASLNEIIWRNFSTDFWVWFKLVGGVFVFMLFIGSQFYWASQHIKQQDNSENQAN